jgi:hypothetical protein
MQWFGRRPERGGSSDPEEPADGALPMLSRSQAARFTTLARDAFAHEGIETTIEEGVLHALDGQRLGLYNIAHAAATVKEREWPRLLADHAKAMAAATNEPDARSLEEIRDQAFLRLTPKSDLPFPAEVGIDLSGELVALPSIDYPQHVKTLTRTAALEPLGGWEAFCERALTNLRGLDADETGTIPSGDDGSGEILLSIGGFFNASRALVLDSVLTRDFRIEQPAHGVLVVMPHRHLLALHPMLGAECVEALRTMLAIAQGEHGQPGALSGHAWIWRHGRLSQVSRETDEGTVAVEASGPFGEALAELGIIDDQP